ncbi:hypothetical protein PALS2_044 [Staphylococcus phage PALS_2]|nr:hypothetical protein PALS2_044 [Staphylococcus phage PALS_2]
MEKVIENTVKELRELAVKEIEFFGEPEINVFHINGYTLISLSRDFYLFTSVKDDNKEILNALLKDDLFNYFDEYDNKFGFFVYYETVVDKKTNKKGEWKNLKQLIDTFEWENGDLLEFVKEENLSVNESLKKKELRESTEEL